MKPIKYLLVIIAFLAYGGILLQAAPPLALGNLAWGANGHLDQGGPYDALSITKQANDLKAVFGAGNTILYRALTDNGDHDVTNGAAFSTAGITPICLVCGYPGNNNNFGDLGYKETNAYTWAYNKVAPLVHNNQAIRLWEIGNEWTLQIKDFSGNGSVPADWTSSTNYHMYRGVMAGAIAAIRDNNTNAQVIGGATSGWTELGLPGAFAANLTNYVTPNGTARNLMWDFTVLHWYNDVAGNNGGGGPNKMGDPADYSTSHLNAYHLLYNGLRPVIVTEFGSSDGDFKSNDVACGVQITNLLNKFLAHVNATGTERGIVGGTAYQMYQMPGAQTDYLLYDYTNAPNTLLAPEGVALQTWIQNNSATNTPPTVSFTSPASGTFYVSPANITMTATASDPDGTVTNVAFYHNNTTSKIGDDATGPYSMTWSNVTSGNYNLTVVATDNDGGSTTSSVVSVVVDALPAASITSPASGTVYSLLANITISASASDTDGVVTNVSFYQGTTLLGQDTASPYNFTWNSVPSGNYNLTVVATDDDGGSTTSSVVNIVVNTPPTAGITSPASGAVFNAPANITINATAADSDGSVTNVAFYQGTTLLGQDTTSPYSLAWNGVPPGTYSLTVVATDDDGMSTTSSVVSVIVNALPTASITSPAAGTVFNAPANITINATAADSDGSVTNVAFYQGTTLLGQDTSSPYTFAWNSVSAGTYNLTVVAKDNLGGATTSSVVAITVNALPTASITNLVSGTVLSAPANIFMQAMASDSDGSVTNVAFYHNNTMTKIGDDGTGPYAMTWSNVIAGTYNLTVVATDNQGGSTTSAVVTVTVSALPSPWLNQDIGSVGVAGGVIYSNSTFMVTGGGADVFGTADAFQFVYQNGSGDCQVQARVASVDNVDPWSKAGVMIRETLDAASRNAAIFITPSNGVNFQWRTNTGSTSTSVHTLGLAAPYWLRLTRTGNSFIGYDSSNGVNWTAVSTQTVVMSSNLYIGLGVTSHNTNAACTSVLDNVTATP